MVSCRHKWLWRVRRLAVALPRDDEDGDVLVDVRAEDLRELGQLLEHNHVVVAAFDRLRGDDGREVRVERVRLGRHVWVAEIRNRVYEAKNDGSAVSETKSS